MSRGSLRRASILAVLVALAACGSSKDATKPDANAQAGDAPKIALKDKPFIAHWDALETRFLPRGEFAPGVATVWAPIHSSVNATLYFVGLRGTFPKYVNPDHEETFFIVSGAGTLDLAGRKPRPVEGGYVVRIPPGYAHGFTATSGEPLEAVLVVAPTVNDPTACPSNVDLPTAAGIIYCEDATSEKWLPPLAAYPQADLKKAVLDQSTYSTLQIAAVGRARIPDHKHLAHDETVILFAQEGFGFLRMDEVVDPVQPIQIAHIPAGCVHSFEHKANGHGRALSIFTPGYDGRDVALVEQKEEAKRPQGYKPYDETGNWVEKDHRETIRVGPEGAPR